MPQIQVVSTGALIAVAQPPVWHAGVWECGDQRFTDPTRTAYAAPSSYPVQTAIQFYLAFKPSERILIKQLATTGIPAGSPFLSPANASAIPADPIVAEFWSTYEVAQAVGSTIDPNLASVQEGLAYLASPTAPTPAIIASGRIAQISAGIPQ